MERGETRDRSDTTAAGVRERWSLQRCFWCEGPHRGEHPLSVCPECAARFRTLRSLEMTGPYPLSDDAIDDALTQTAPGNYALGFMDGDVFTVFYVGRSDSDLRRRLHEWVGMPSRDGSYASLAKAPWETHRRGPLLLDTPALGPVGSAASSYTRFAYSFAASAQAAFEKEWRNYEDFGGDGVLDNEAPPARTAGTPTAPGQE